MKFFLVTIALLLQLALAHKGHSHSHDSHDGHNHGESHKLIEFFKSKWTETVAYLDQNFPNEMAEFYKAEQQHKVFEKASTGLMTAKTTAIEWLKNPDPLRSLAVVAGAIVFTPLLLVQLLPAKIPEFILLSLVGFAVGTLLSDVFVHILPHTFSSASNEQDKILVGLCVVGGIVGFVVLDKFIRALSGSSGHHHDHHHNHSDKKNDGPVQGNVESFGSSTSFSQGNIVYNDQQDGLRKRNVAGGNPSNTTGKSPQKEHKEHKHSHGTHETKPSSFGYLTVVANILHTVSDGFTLAVAHYSSNPLIAFSTSLAIFLHEVPHKMGDYAIMRKSGFSKGYAFFMQVLLSLGTLLGVGLGMYVYQFSGSGVGNVKEDIDSLEKWILPATAGGLLYTACVGILPEFLESNGFFSFMFSLCSLLNGVIFMTAISLTE
jgi:zinc transporter 7